MSALPGTHRADRAGTGPRGWAGPDRQAHGSTRPHRPPPRQYGTDSRAPAIPQRAHAPDTRAPSL